jgi:nicotinamidase-related amidase
MFPGAPLIRRTTGTISAWDYLEFVAAIEKTGRKNLIMADVTIEYGSPFAAMQAIEAGYNVYGVVDASGGLDVTTRELTRAIAESW